MKKRWIQVNVIITFLISSWILISQAPIEQYLSKLQTDAMIVSKQADALYKEIDEKSAAYEILPQDATIDRVWKAIPGYNGLKVDVKASYEKMKTDKKFSENKLVFQQTKPSIQLKDLPPAPVYKGHPDKPMVSFIINVAWGNEYLSSMLAILKKHHVKATFFLEGRWVKENPELAKMIADAGHEVGNHSFTHADFKRISAEQIREELVKTNEVIQATTGKSVKWFAPPSGSFRDEAVHIAAEHDLGTIMWTVDTIDWKKPTVSVLINRVMSKVHPGALILMHPTEPTSQALDQLIIAIKKKDLTIDSVSSLLSEQRMMKKITKHESP